VQRVGGSRPGIPGWGDRSHDAEDSPTGFAEGRHGAGGGVCEAVQAVNRTIKHLAAFVAIVGFGGSALAATLAFAVPATRSLTFGTTSSDAITPVLQTLDQRSVVLDRHGHTIATLYATEDRAPVTLQEVAPAAIAAVVSIEDRTFFSHRGVDPKSILRALSADFHSGKFVQGGSTITQQLVKNTLIENPQKDLQRKVREAVLAMRLEQIYTKDEILERYLNTVYFGRDAYGIRAASERYFNEHPIDLTIPQAAMLAGIISAPSAYDPILHPVAARHRREQVLVAMRETGVIDEKAVTAFDRSPLPKRAYKSATIAPTSYFVAQVVQRLLNDKRLGPDVPTRRNLIYHGGLRITTTYDPTLQKEAETALRTQIAAAARQPNIPVTGALVAIDNSNGAVRAMVSGSGNESGAAYLAQEFNYATGANRQVGSSFKVFTLATALENGFAPNDTIDGTSGCQIPPGLTTDNKPYSPGGEGGGVLTLRTAITDSINCAFVRLIVALGADPANPNAQGYTRAAAGPQKVIDVAHEMGVTSPLKPFTSLTLGTEGVSPLDMASAYSTLANDGVHRPPIFVTKVQGPDGKVVFEEPPSGHSPKQVMPVNIARTETEMLFGPVRSGTASRTLSNFPRPIAGKTGTTDNNVDAWFVGFSPQITTAVWMGDPAGDTVSMNPFFNVGAVNGGTIPARIWNDFMGQALASLPIVNFTPPDPSFWPSSRFISIEGRGRGSPPTTTTTTVPTPTTVKPKKKKTTPTTNPKTTPTTKPGTPTTIKPGGP
jgi:membrane peptidoglycan carboxypeptidase